MQEREVRKATSLVKKKLSSVPSPIKCTFGTTDEKITHCTGHKEPVVSRLLTCKKGEGVVILSKAACDWLIIQMNNYNLKKKCSCVIS